MKKGRIYILCIICLAVFNIFSLFKQGELKRKLSIQDNKISAMQVRQDETMSLREKEYLQVISGNTILPDSLDPFPTTQISGLQYVLVLRISEEDCYNCYNNIFNEVKDFVECTGENYIYVWGKFDHISKLKSVVLNRFGNIENLRIVRELPLNMEAFGAPYAFVIDSTRRTNYVYAFEKSQPGYARKYFEYISRLFSENN